MSAISRPPTAMPFSWIWPAMTSAGIMVSCIAMNAAAPGDASELIGGDHPVGVRVDLDLGGRSEQF